MAFEFQVRFHKGSVVMTPRTDESSQIIFFSDDSFNDDGVSASTANKGDVMILI